MKNLITCLFACGLLSLSAQISFVNRNNLLQNASNHSGVAIAILDMNKDGLDDIVHLNQGTQLRIEYQNGSNQAFTTTIVGDMLNESAWGMCAADVDNNGFPDVLAGGSYEGVKVFMADATGAHYQLKEPTDPGTFVQGVNFADINNDGWLDAFVCHDDGISRIFKNDGAGNLVYTPNVINMNTMPLSDNSGNYGTVWSDVNNDGFTDLYIAKCRQGVSDPTDGRRINQLFLNNGNGTYTQDLDNHSGLRIGAQSWTADFGDMDNDGDMDCFVTNHDVNSQLLENDGTGVFTDISDTSNIATLVGGLPIQGIFRDFDNDGYLDVLVAGSAQYVLKNNGDKTFTNVPLPFNSNIMESFAVGDLNHDGFVDIYGGYASIYTNPTTVDDVIWMNEGNANHYFGLNLVGVQSNKDGIGARITIHTPSGLQIREVRSGESYGIMNSLQALFGLGQNMAIDSVIINWPAGTKDVIKNPVIDQYITVQEGGCVLPQVRLEALSSTTFCSGDSVVLVAPAGYSYLWNTGATTQTIAVTQQATYFVEITTAEGCKAISDKKSVIVDPFEAVSIKVIGDSVLCYGATVALSVPESSSYLWSNGATTQEILVSAGGHYSATVQGECQLITSPTVTVEVLNPALPSLTSGTTWVGGSVDLTGTGDVLHWYDAALSGNEIFVGNTFQTPPLAETTTYWVSNHLVNDMPNENVGMANHSGSQFGGTQYNGQIVFDCFQAIRLSKVKVYSNLAAVRRIVLKNTIGAILQAKTISIPAGQTVIDLNFDIPVGQNLVLTTDETINMANLNTTSPQLRRSDAGVTYPYSIFNVISLKNSNLGSDRFYYFFNWEIDYYGKECESNRVAVEAVVDTSLVNTKTIFAEFKGTIAPNPAGNWVEITFFEKNQSDVVFRLYDAQGKLLTVKIDKYEAKSRIDLSGLPAGVYSLLMTDSQGVRGARIVHRLD
jgi:hypothetical protein